MQHFGWSRHQLIHTSPGRGPPDGQGQGHGEPEPGGSSQQPPSLAPSPLTLLRDVGRYVAEMVEAAAAGVSAVGRDGLVVRALLQDATLMNLENHGDTWTQHPGSLAKQHRPASNKL